MTVAGPGASHIERSIRAAATRGQPALAGFLTAGFPRMTSFGDLVDAVAAEVDVIEIGVPFTDPMADGVTIQESSRRALREGVNLRWILDVVRAQRHHTPIVLMSYLNPLIALGIGDLGQQAAAAGVSGFIVPDLPCEECLPLRSALQDVGLALIQLVTPLTPPDRVRRLCELSRGFVYAVTRTGVTGASSDRTSDMLDYLDRVRAVSPIPVLAGFGIRAPSHVSTLASHVDGVIVGSALIEVLERGDDPVAFLRTLRDEKATASEELA